MTNIGRMVLLPATGIVSCGDVPMADLVFKNGVVMTVDPGNPRVSAVAVAGDRILAVGSDSEMEKHIRAGQTRVIDLGGRMLVPGFNDSHMHLFELGASLEQVDLAGVDSFEEFVRRVGQRVGESKPGEWVTGRGWDQSLLPGGAWPARELIDSVSPVNPVVLERIDGHSCLVNSLVLKLSGITRDTPQPDHGEIVRDPATGEPNGVFTENARRLLKPVPPPEDEDLARRRQLGLVLEQARRLGVTSVTNFWGGEKYLDEALEKGELTLRVNVGHDLTDNPETVGEYKRLREKYRDNRYIRFGPLKAFIDGTLGSSTAAMLDPFADNPSSIGTLMMSEERLESLVLTADRDSFQVAVHAIGDRGNRVALNAFEKTSAGNGRRDSRHRVEHVSVLHPDDIPRFASLGVIAAMQPAFCLSDRHFAGERLGAGRCLHVYAWNSLLASGAILAFSTDSPVELLNPLEGLYAAVTRGDRRDPSAEAWFPQESITLEQAIEAYTLGSARAEFQEHEKGSLAPGKLADMVVLSQDLFAIPELTIMETKVDYTVFDGRIVYERGSN